MKGRARVQFADPIASGVSGSGRDDGRLPDAPGEASDLRAIYRAHGRFVWLSLQRLGVQPSDLDDVAQDVFVIVHRRLDSFDRRARVTTWLFGICMRVAANYRRRRRWTREPAGRTTIAPPS
jgi:RNA polymerase sigma-70 factor, ECF subfamily